MSSAEIAWCSAALSLLVFSGGCQPQNTSSQTAEIESSLSSDELMHLVIEPAADVLWDSAGWIMTLEGETSLVPTTDEEWYAVESAAGTIIASGDLLKIPYPSEDRGGLWSDFADQLTQQGRVAQEAILNRDGDALFEAGATLYQSCVQCHNVYWTDQQ